MYRSLVYAVSGLPDDLGRLRAAAQEAGADSVQLNLRDTAVEGALRLDHLEPAIEAVITVPGRAELEQVLTPRLDELCGVVRGWWAETEAALPPAPVADGERLDALANVALLRRPEDLAEADWLRIWKQDHTGVAIRTQGTFGYVQHRVTAALPGSPAVAAVVEEHFPMAALHDIHAFYGSGGDDEELSRRMTELMASCARFGADRDLDLVPTSRYLWTSPR